MWGGCVSGLSAVVLTSRACLMPCAANNDYSNVVDIFNVASGAWSTAALSQGRSDLAATSLPNAGVAVFAGGNGTLCDVFCVCMELCMGVRGMREWVERGCVDVAGLPHALCSGGCLFECCGYLQRGVWNLEHCSSQPGSIFSRSHIAAECRSRGLRWWPLYVFLFLFEA